MSGISGFISVIGSLPYKKTMIDYYKPVHFSITQYEPWRSYSSAQRKELKLLDRSMWWTHLTLVWAWMPFPWYESIQISNHSIFPGPFHNKMNFISMLTKKRARRSGFVEILIEAKLVTSWVLVSVFSVKADSKAVFSLKAVVEALERLSFEFFAKESEIEFCKEALLNLINACSSSSCREQLDKALQDQPVIHITNKYKEFQTKVPDGHLGKMAQFWISFMDIPKLVFLLTHSVKTNNRKLFHKCNGDMANLFFAFDLQNFSRWVLFSFFWNTPPW